MRYVYLIVTILLALFHGKLQCIRLDTWSKCSRLRQSSTQYAPNATVYLQSVIQCGVYCENSSTSLRYFYYNNKACQVYSYFPGFSGVCATDNTRMRRYCLGKQITDLRGGFLNCTNINMTLASLETASEIRFVFDFLLNSGCVWTSAYSNNVVGNQWIWKGSGVNISTYAWSLGHPALGYFLTDSGITMCFGGMFYSQWNTTWMTAAPINLNRPLCEQDLTPFVF